MPKRSPEEDFEILQNRSTKTLLHPLSHTRAHKCTLIHTHTELKFFLPRLDLEERTRRRNTSCISFSGKGVTILACLSWVLGASPPTRRPGIVARSPFLTLWIQYTSLVLMTYHCRNRNCTRLMPGGTASGQSAPTKVKKLVSGKPTLYGTFAVNTGIFSSGELLGTRFMSSLLNLWHCPN